MTGFMSMQGDIDDFVSGLDFADRDITGHVSDWLAVPAKRLLAEPALTLAQALQQPRPSQGTQALLAFLAGYKTYARHLLRAAIRFCRFVREPRAYGLLRDKLLKDERLITVHADVAEAMVAIQGTPALGALVEVLWKRPYDKWHHREDAILTLLGASQHPSAVPHLIKALAAPYRRPYNSALRALTTLSPALVADALLHVLRRDPHVRRRAGALRVLAAHGDARLVAVVSAWLEPGAVRDPSLLIEATKALRLFGDQQRAEAVLLTHLADPSPKVRALALSAFSGLVVESQAVMDALIHGLSAKEPEVRVAATNALSGRSSAEEVLASACWQEKAPHVRLVMVDALVQSAGPAALACVLKILESYGAQRPKDPTPFMAEVLRRMAKGEPHWAPILQRFRSHRSRKVAAAALFALKEVLAYHFEWPDPEEPPAYERLPLFAPDDAKRLLVPPAPPPQVGFLRRVFQKPQPVRLQPQARAELEWNHDVLRLRQGPTVTEVHWTRRFGLHLRWQPAAKQDLGRLHVQVTQREPGVGARFVRIEFSLWSKETPALVGYDRGEGEFLAPNAHQATGLLAALRFFYQAHGGRLLFET